MKHGRRDAAGVPQSLLLAGLGATNRAAARALAARGHTVSVFDDNPDEAAADAAAELGLDLERAPGSRRLDELVRAADALIPTPGLPERHPVLAAARASSSTRFWPQIQCSLKARAINRMKKAPRNQRTKPIW